MKIILEKYSPNLGGDISALARLMVILEKEKENLTRNGTPYDARELAIVELWLKYINNIVSDLYQSKIPASFEYSFPFEKDFSDTLNKVKQIEQEIDKLVKETEKE